MPPDRYTKAMLTIIAACLLADLLGLNPPVRKASAQFAGGPIHVILDSVNNYAFQYAEPLRVVCANCRR